MYRISLSSGTTGKCLKRVFKQCMTLGQRFKVINYFGTKNQTGSKHIIRRLHQIPNLHNAFLQKGTDIVNCNFCINFTF